MLTTMLILLGPGFVAQFAVLGWETAVTPIQWHWLHCVNC